MPRAYDLVGDVTMPAEVFPRLEALERMVMTLAFAGHPDAAQESLDYLTKAREFTAATKHSLGRLRGIWKAVEMSDRSDVPVAERAERVAAAVEDYRGSAPLCSGMPDNIRLAPIRPQ